MIFELYLRIFSGNLLPSLNALVSLVDSGFNSQATSFFGAEAGIFSAVAKQRASLPPPKKKGDHKSLETYPGIIIHVGKKLTRK